MLDDGDKRVLLKLLRDGRSSVRRIALETGLSPQLVSYKIKSMLSKEVIKGFSVVVNPNTYGYYYGFVAVDASLEDLDRSVAWAKCLERIDLAEIYSGSLEDLQRDMERITSRGRLYTMSYIPPQRPLKRSRVVQSFIEALWNKPRSSMTDLSKEVGIPARKALKIYRWLARNRLVTVVPIVDLDKAGIVIALIFTTKIDSIIFPAEEYYEILLYIRDPPRGLLIVAFKDISRAKSFIDTIRSFDGEADIMVITEYRFNRPR